MRALERGSWRLGRCGRLGRARSRPMRKDGLGSRRAARSANGSDGSPGALHRRLERRRSHVRSGISTVVRSAPARAGRVPSGSLCSSRSRLIGMRSAGKVMHRLIREVDRAVFDGALTSRVRRHAARVIKPPPRVANAYEGLAVGSNECQRWEGS